VLYLWKSLVVGGHGLSRSFTASSPVPPCRPVKAPAAASRAHVEAIMRKTLVCARVGEKMPAKCLDRRLTSTGFGVVVGGSSSLGMKHREPLCQDRRRLMQVQNEQQPVIVAIESRG
jgi:hypothetical protein